jgi:type I restriction enzyme S subunit
MKKVALKELAKVDWGNTSLTKSSYIPNGKFLAVSATGCDGKINHAEHSYGTLVLSAIGANCGKMFLPDSPFTAIKNTITISPNESVDSKYLFRYLNNFQIGSRGAGQPFITKSDTEKKLIPLPPLEQQKKIAAILDAADAYRQKTKELIAKYDELTQSLFLDMFGDPVKNEKGWEIKTINDVCSLQGGYSFKSKDFIPEAENTVKVVKITNVHFEDLVWGEVDCLPDYYLDKYSNFSLNEGDILLALTRPIIKSLGTVKAVTVKSIDIPCLLNQRVARISPNEKLINKSFLLRFIFGDNFKNKIEKFSSTSLQPNVSNKQIEGIEIMLPPLLIQNQFAERAQAIEVQKAQAQASLEKAEELFNSLLQKAFKGELV